MKKFSSLSLAWYKFAGCTREFGFVESIRRIHKEISKSLAGDDKHLDISWIASQVAVGAAPRSGEMVEALKKTGVTDIIDLRAERDMDSDALCQERGLSVHWVPALDDWKPKTSAFFDPLFHQTQVILSDPQKKLFVCCGAGEHRAPLGGIVALITLGWTMDDAMYQIRGKRPVSEFLTPYVSSLKNYKGLNIIPRK
jgi:hypothetical protein